jgi:hypothetical protein
VPTSGRVRIALPEVYITYSTLLPFKNVHNILGLTKKVRSHTGSVFLLL